MRYNVCYHKSNKTRDQLSLHYKGLQLQLKMQKIISGSMRYSKIQKKSLKIWMSYSEKLTMYYLRVLIQSKEHPLIELNQNIHIQSHYNNKDNHHLDWKRAGITGTNITAPLKTLSNFECDIYFNLNLESSQSSQIKLGLNLLPLNESGDDLLLQLS